MKQQKYILPVALITGLLIVFSATAIDAVKSSLKLCADALIPSLFPFFVCSNLLLNLGAADTLSKLFTPLMKPLFRLRGSCSLAIIMGYISGYPVGAKTAADLYLDGSCSKYEAEKMLSFCNNSGPMFIIGALGSGILKDISAGALIYLSHILSSLTVAMCMRGATLCSVTPAGKTKPKAILSFGEIFTESVSSSVLSMLTVCGFVIIFGILVSFIEKLGIISCLSSLGIDYSLCKAIIYGFLECSGGCSAAATAVKSPLAQYMLLSAVVAWSGLSVHLQVLGIIKKAKLSSKLYFKGKVLMTIISPVITMFLYGFKSGKLRVLPFFRLAAISFTTVFLLIKTISMMKKLYFKYSALPPR